MLVEVKFIVEILGVELTKKPLTSYVFSLCEKKCISSVWTLTELGFSFLLCHFVVDLLTHLG